MKKRILSLALAAVMVLTCVLSLTPTVSAANEKFEAKFVLSKSTAKVGDIVTLYFVPTENTGINFCNTQIFFDDLSVVGCVGDEDTVFGLKSLCALTATGFQLGYATSGKWALIYGAADVYTDVENEQPLWSIDFEVLPTAQGEVEFTGDIQEMVSQFQSTGTTPWFQGHRAVAPATLTIDGSVPEAGKYTVTEDELEDYGLEVAGDYYDTFVEDGVLSSYGFDEYANGEIALAPGIDEIFEAADWYDGVYDSATTLYIPDSVTYIGEGAFFRKQKKADSVTLNDYYIFGNPVIDSKGIGYAASATTAANGTLAKANVNPNVTIHAFKGTEAEAYAEENGIAFEALDNFMARGYQEGNVANIGTDPSRFRVSFMMQYADFAVLGAGFNISCEGVDYDYEIHEVYSHIASENYGEFDAPEGYYLSGLVIRGLPEDDMTITVTPYVTNIYGQRIDFEDQAVIVSHSYDHNQFALAEVDD